MKAGRRTRRVALVVFCVGSAVATIAKLREGAPQAAAPPGRFVVQPVNGDVVHDARLGLSWQRAVPSLVLPDTDSPPNDRPARHYCATLQLVTFTSGFRLPTVEELQSLIDTRVNPTWDSSFFPTPPNADVDAGFDDPHGMRFWTSTPVASYALATYYVDFDDGSVDAVGSYVTLRLRCVHDDP